jgi:hypothetical protein
MPGKPQAGEWFAGAGPKVYDMPKHRRREMLKTIAAVAMLLAGCSVAYAQEGGQDAPKPPKTESMAVEIEYENGWSIRLVSMTYNFVEGTYVGVALAGKKVGDEFTPKYQVKYNVGSVGKMTMNNEYLTYDPYQGIMAKRLMDGSVMPFITDSIGTWIRRQEEDEKDKKQPSRPQNGQDQR